MIAAATTINQRKNKNLTSNADVQMFTNHLIDPGGISLTPILPSAFFILVSGNGYKDTIISARAYKATPRT